MKEWLRFLDRPLIRAADALRDQRRWAEAADVYRQILQRRPDRAGVWVQLGHCLGKLGRPLDALEAYRAADRVRPDHVDTLLHLANTQLRLGHGEDAQAIYDRLLALDPDKRYLVSGALLGSDYDGQRAEWIDHVILGTTGTCNASCVHCPTGKPSTAHSPRTPMPMPLFRKIIDEIAESGMRMAGQVAFGLFGDGLLDPFVVERARYLRERLPDVLLDINTNGAAYDPKKHAALNQYVSIISLHCESLVPETYDFLMQPLRAERVHVKYPMIFRDFPDKVWVSAPLSRLNADERPAIADHFYRLGAVNVDFPPMSNRLGHDEELFGRISFAPAAIRCKPRILYNLIVDCDGKVLACCNDFSRIEPIGDLSRESIAETFASQSRLSFASKLAQGCHGDIATCRSCKGDTPATVPPIGELVQTPA